MGLNKQDIALDALLDEALARAVNVEPPAGLEARILAQLDRRKARTRKRIEVACLALATAAVWGFALLQPMKSIPGEITTASASVYSNEVFGSPLPTSRSISESAPSTSDNDRVRLRQNRPLKARTATALPAEVHPPKSSFIEDLSIPPLKLADMQMASLSELR
jgi:hypothetical protein